jgi:adenosylcobyric acid synthase
MLQGTGSNVGKSLLVAGLCRATVRRGLTVRPFKPQNMSNNAAVTVDGGEIGRAQALQALACGVEPHTDMNPVLLKPETDIGAQVIVQGKRRATVKARDYARLKPELIAPVLESFERLKAQADLVIVEGAGSPAEINLRDGDIVNMAMAEAADAPVILVGDIDLGGVFASLLGTVMLLTEEERSRVKGVIINKFRGDVKILEPGLRMLEERIHIPVLGVVPWMEVELEDEDSVTARFHRVSGQGDLDVAVIRLPHISNFTDF